MLSNVSVNHSLTGPRCKNGTSKCWEDFTCPPPLWDCTKVAHVPDHLRVIVHTRVGGFPAGKLKVMMVNRV